ncbi:MAG: 4Fe-4S binding protein [bacterium]
MKKVLFFGIFLIIVGLLLGDLNFLSLNNTYGKSLSFLSPSIKNLALLKEYQFEEIEKKPFIIIVFIIFPLLFFLLFIKNKEIKLKINRWFIQWLSFVITRLGVIRVSGICPVDRTSLGVLPFLNCSSCEMAVGACPIGSLQLFFVQKKPPSFILGMLILLSLSLGRFLCGWLCPFGTISDILNKIRRPKIKIPQFLIYGKYLSLILVILAFFIPFTFCSWLCPSGLLYGLLPYYLTTGKSAFCLNPFVLYHIILGLVFLCLFILISGRLFCRILCPLGGILGLFNKVSLVRIVHNKELCKSCGICLKECPMGVDLGKGDFANLSNCIMCSKCIKLCQQKARRWSYEGKVV